MRKCPACAEEIKKEAIKCKHCQSDVPPFVKPKASGKTLKIFYGCLGVFLLIALTGMFSYTTAQFAVNVGLFAALLSVICFFVVSKLRLHAALALVVIVFMNGCNIVNVGNLAPKEVKELVQKEAAKDAAEAEMKRIKEQSEKAAEEKKLAEAKANLAKLDAKLEKIRVRNYGKFYGDYGAFRVYGVKASRDDDRFEVTGVVVNASEKPVRYLQADVQLFDSGGSRCGQAFTNATELGVGDSWRFKAVAYSSEAKTYRVSDVWGRGY